MGFALIRRLSRVLIGFRRGLLGAWPPGTAAGTGRCAAIGLVAIASNGLSVGYTVGDAGQWSAIPGIAAQGVITQWDIDKRVDRVKGERAVVGRGLALRARRAVSTRSTASARCRFTADIGGDETR